MGGVVASAGSANVITTTLGTLNMASTTVTKNGGQLVIGWNFTPTPSLVGTQGVYLEANDSFGMTSGWQDLGSWTITASLSTSSFPEASRALSAGGVTSDAGSSQPEPPPTRNPSAPSA